MQTLALALTFQFVVFTTAAASLPSVSSNMLETRPTEIYGPTGAPVLVRLGNGGAGPTGLLRALAEDFLAVRGLHGRIAWYRNISHFTLQALGEQRIDVALTYEPEEAQRAVTRGWALHSKRVFHDHFLLVGPEDNPAGLQPQDSAVMAFQRIAKHAASTQDGLFLSRDDESGTHHRERALWAEAGTKPWLGALGTWYVRAAVFPAEALLRADREGLYTLTDRGTWLSSRSTVRRSRVYVQGGQALLNPCNVLLSPTAGPVARDFVDYLMSSRGQHLIATFASTAPRTAPLFTSAKQEDFAPGS